MIKSATTLVETLMLIKEQPTEKTLNSKLINWFRALTQKLRDDYCTFYKIAHKIAVKISNWYRPQLILNVFDTINT